MVRRKISRGKTAIFHIVDDGSCDESREGLVMCNKNMKVDILSTVRLSDFLILVITNPLKYDRLRASSLCLRCQKHVRLKHWVEEW